MLENESNAQSAEWLGSGGDQLAQQALSRDDTPMEAYPPADQRASTDGRAAGAAASPARTNHGTGRLGSCTSCEARR